MTRRRLVAASLLLVSALTLAALGQFYFLRRREFLWDGLAFHVLAALSFVLAWRLTLVRPRTSPAGAGRHVPWSTLLAQRPSRTMLLVLSLALALFAALLARNRMGHQATGDIVALWLLGIVSVLTAVFWPDPLRGELRLKRRSNKLSSSGLGPSERRLVISGLWRGWIAHLRKIRRDTWLEIAIITGLTVVALIFRVTALGCIPFTLSGDEAWNGLESRQVLRGELRNPFLMGHLSMPTTFSWPVSWSMRVVGDNMAGLRLPQALVGTATVPIFYVFVRRLWGRRTAFLATSFLAGYHYHIHFSRIGINNAWDPLFALLFLWLLDRGVAGKRSSQSEDWQMRNLVLAGLVLGLSSYFYTGARLLPLLLVLYLAFFWVRARLTQTPTPRNLAWHLALLVLTFLVTSGPMLGFAQANPRRWNARLNQVGILQSGWLDLAREMTGKGTLELLAEQFLRAAGAFHVFPDRTVWYGAAGPLLGFLSGLFAVLGMAWAVAHWRQRGHFLLLAWFWTVIITGGMLTESPPSSQRLVMAIPPVALLVAIGLEQVARLARRLLSARGATPHTNKLGYSQSVRSDSPKGKEYPTLMRRLVTPGREDRENLVLGLLILVLVASSVRFYFVEFTPSHRYGSANGEAATMMGHYLRDLEGPLQVYFFGAPRIYWGFGTMQFLAPDAEGIDVIDPLDAPPTFVDDVLAADRNSVFLFLPERAGDLYWVREAIPSGRVREFPYGAGGIAFVSYEIEL